MLSVTVGVVVSHDRGGFVTVVMRIMIVGSFPGPSDIKEGHAGCIEGVDVRERTHCEGHNQQSCQEVLHGRGGRREKTWGAANPDCEGARICQGKNESGRHCTPVHYHISRRF